MKKYLLFVVLFTITPLMTCAQTENTHIVQRGETFALIAKHYGLTEQELKNANPNADICYGGLKLKIPTKLTSGNQTTNMKDEVVVETMQPHGYSTLNAKANSVRTMQDSNNGVTVSIVQSTDENENGKNDGKFIVQMESTSAVDQKCDVYDHAPSVEEIEQLFQRGRYVESISSTKFGFIIVHKRNTDNIKQSYEITNSAEKEKLIKKKFKEGYVFVSCCNKYAPGVAWQYYYCLFGKHPEITEQKLTSKYLTQKLLDKYSKKGLFLTSSVDNVVKVFQNAKNIERQKCVSYGTDEQKMLDDFQQMEYGWHLGCVEISYNQHSNRTYYTAVLNKYNDERGESQYIGLFETMNDFTACFGKNMCNSLNIQGIWGGYEATPYALFKQMADSYNPDILGIVTGLTNSVIGLTGGYKSSASRNNDSSTVSSSSKKSKGSKKKSSASSDCKHCSGTGICPYCNGDGYNYVAGNPVQCTACKGHIGRCKWCNK